MGEPRPLSVGDAVAVAALLVFLIGWSGGWLWFLSTIPEPDVDLNIWDSWVVGAVIAIPALWVSRLISHIIKGPWAQR